MSTKRQPPAPQTPSSTDPKADQPQWVSVVDRPCDMTSGYVALRVVYPGVGGGSPPPPASEHTVSWWTGTEFLSVFGNVTHYWPIPFGTRAEAQAFLQRGSAADLESRP